MNAYMNPSHDASEFVASKFVQTILYGVYVVTMSHCLRWIVYECDHEDEREGGSDHHRRGGYQAKWRARIKVDWMLMLAFTVFVLETTHLGLGISLAIREMVSEKMPSETDLRSINTVIECMTALLADAVLIYRCWVVYAKSYRMVCLPLVLWMSCLACPFFVTNCYVPVFPLAIGQGLVKSWGNVSPLLYAAFTFFGCHVGTNIYASYAVVTRTWHVSNDSFKSRRRLGVILRVLIESGVLYTCTSALNLLVHCLVAAGHPFFLLPQELLHVINFAVAAISFNLILARIIQETPGQLPAGSKAYKTSRQAYRV